MNTRVCGVCGKRKPSKDFGDGTTLPRTTCLECFERIRESQKPKKEKKINPIEEFLEELRREGKL